MQCDFPSGYLTIRAATSVFCLHLCLGLQGHGGFSHVWVSQGLPY